MVITTQEIIDKFGLKDSGHAENGYTISEISGLVDINQAKEIIEYFISSIRYYEFDKYDLDKILKFWEKLDDTFGKQYGKFSIARFTDNRYDQIFGFEMNVNGDVFVIEVHSNHTDSPFIWKRYGNYNWRHFDFDSFYSGMTIGKK